MEVVHLPAEARERTARARARGRSIGFVPTMGALHEGHLSLVRAARKETDCVVVSVFVNPTQFGPGEDFNAYPRTLEADCAACEAAGADIVFAPRASDMYPPGFATYVVMGRLADRLCGAFRPGHFHGVCTVVAKLFNIVGPDVAYFGQKDYQQTVVIARMVRDLDFGVRLRVLPTVREADGLAMSSRNRYLTPDERRQATCLYQALRRAEDLTIGGERDAHVIQEEMTRILESAPLGRIEYVAIVDPDELTDLDRIEHTAVAAVAVRFGNARLIDNTLLPPQASPDTAGATGEGAT